jgi:thermostable 8-oxoguanine DNA glycosylase
MIQFKDKQEILDLVARAGNYKDTVALNEMMLRLKKERQELYLDETEFNAILKWKLRQQYGRQEAKRKANTPENIEATTKLCFNIPQLQDNVHDTRLRVHVLTALQGVGVPVASAILTFWKPETYAVIDFRNWRQLFEGPRAATTCSVKEYLAYLKVLQEMAAHHGVTMQQLDIAIWQKDIETPHPT